METSRNSTNSSLFQSLGLLEDSDQPLDSSPPRVLTLLASVLEKMIQKNDKFSFREEETITVFHGARTPSKNIKQYTERIHRYAKCSPACFVTAFIYILRYLQRSETHHLTTLNVHRLLIASFLAAAKFLDRKCYNNAYYARIGGVDNEEMNLLERTFLFDLDFRLNITIEIFEKHCLMLQRGTVPCVSRNPRTVLGVETTTNCEVCDPQHIACSCSVI